MAQNQELRVLLQSLLYSTHVRSLTPTCFRECNTPGLLRHMHYICTHTHNIVIHHFFIISQFLERCRWYFVKSVTLVTASCTCPDHLSGGDLLYNAREATEAAFHCYHMFLLPFFSVLMKQQRWANGVHLYVSKLAVAHK